MAATAQAAFLRRHPERHRKFRVLHATALRLGLLEGGEGLRLSFSILEKLPLAFPGLAIGHHIFPPWTGSGSR